MQDHDRLSWSLLVALLLAVLVPLAAHANITGVNSSGGCGNCHGNNASGALSVSIAGPTELEMNATATYTLSISGGGPQTVGGALSVLPDVGSLSVVDANTTMVTSAVTHSAANVGVWSYNFDLTAPDVAGTVTLSFAGMAFSGDGNASNRDSWNVGSYLVAVVTPEPATALLVSLGIGMLALAGRRRKA